MSAHIPVLLDEVLAALDPAPGAVIVDATFGAGGYSRALLDAGAGVIALDRDPTAIAGGEALRAASNGRLTLVEAPFDQLAAVLKDLGAPPVQGVVFDFGVSSMQLDIAARGFSFLADGPLDMRMGQGRSAAEFVQSASEAELAAVFFEYGEERRARALARAIVADRSAAPFLTTASLAGLAERVVGKTGHTHPATRAFQALRIFINDELGQIVRALMATEGVLREGGRLAAVSFHSLEDRIVKKFLAEVSADKVMGSRHRPEHMPVFPTFTTLGKGQTPSPAELARNPRARSARLRAAVRTAAPSRGFPPERLSSLGVPPLVFSELQRAWGC